MFLAILLALIVIVLVLVMAFVFSIMGAGAIIIFGDVIVCVFILIWIIKRLICRKR